MPTGGFLIATGGIATFIQLGVTCLRDDVTTGWHGYGAT